MSQLQEIIQKQYTPQEAAVIEHAHELAVKAHEGQMRESGEPYIMHPENVALILAQMGMDAETVCAALLHDVVEDTEISEAEIVEQFGSTFL